MATLEPMHYFLAYAGMLIYVLVKLAEVFPLPDFDYKKFIRQNIISVLISLIGIPVLLIVATDTSLHDIFPINYATAVLCGWQTQSVFKSLFQVVANRRGLNGNGTNGSTTPI